MPKLELPNTTNVWPRIGWRWDAKKIMIGGTNVITRLNSETNSTSELRGPAVNEQMTVFGSIRPKTTARTTWQL